MSHGQAYGRIIESVTCERFHHAHDQVIRDLLEARLTAGHWEGELSSSALSTATAVTALALMDRHSLEPGQDTTALQQSGIQWLAEHVNDDGGWGDTVLSLSNISTTALVWAAFAAVDGAEEEHADLMRRTEQWLTKVAGALTVASLSQAIIKRYGKDRTFSIPILTMCALSGRFGKGRDAWKTILPLPFEMAAMPPTWYATLKLPVVSYALPALIAIGQVRHHCRPSINPLVRLIRHWARKTTLKRLLQIQPTSGGFLEATPLTSFVVMSLAGCEQGHHPVAKAGLQFLKASVRSDGSWPIDTNLATWVSSLAVHGLGERGRKHLTPDAKDRLLTWFLNQQYRSIHPYTQAKPGGWAWTDLPGGVPDADDTPGALIAIFGLTEDPESIADRAAEGVQWLLDLQNRDGGIPTFCRGWGTLPFDRSSADLTAHCLRAWSLWHGYLPAEMQSRVERAMDRATAFLRKEQSADGQWVPLWFGNQHVQNEANPVYGTTKVMEGLLSLHPTRRDALAGPLEEALDWLVHQQNQDGGWGGALAAPSSHEETALALSAVATALRHLDASKAALAERSANALERGLAWLLPRIEDGTYRHVSPIGFYFAKLWYYEDMYPLVMTGAAMHQMDRLRHADPANQAKPLSANSEK